MENHGARPGTEPKVSFRILHRCNFLCPSCSTFSHPDRKGMMNPMDFKRAIDTLAKENFHGQLNISGGEPTLYPELNGLIRYASQQLGEAQIALFTNGHWVGQNMENNIPEWKEKLQSLLSAPNVLVRFSIDLQHAQGAHRTGCTNLANPTVSDIEKERLGKALMFLEACRGINAIPGVQFDFAYKGTLDEARCYTKPLGNVPIYLIQFQPDPGNRIKKPGFLALDVDEKNRISVYTTLGHIPRNEAVGGIEALPEALRINRQLLGKTIF